MSQYWFDPSLKFQNTAWQNLRWQAGKKELTGFKKVQIC